MIHRVIECYIHQHLHGIIIRHNELHRVKKIAKELLLGLGGQVRIRKYAIR